MITLVTINLPNGRESHEDTQWQSYDAMIEWVKREFPEFTSLVITVLP